MSWNLNKQCVKVGPNVVDYMRYSYSPQCLDSRIRVTSRNFPMVEESKACILIAKTTRWTCEQNTLTDQ